MRKPWSFGVSLVTVKACRLNKHSLKKLKCIEVNATEVLKRIESKWESRVFYDEIMREDRGLFIDCG